MRTGSVSFPSAASRVSGSGVVSALYGPWAPGTYPLNTYLSYNGTIVKVENPAGTSATPPEASNADWLVFANQAAVEKYIADLLS